MLVRLLVGQLVGRLSDVVRRGGRGLRRVLGALVASAGVGAGVDQHLGGVLQSEPAQRGRVKRRRLGGGHQAGLRAAAKRTSAPTCWNWDSLRSRLNIWVGPWLGWFIAVFTVPVAVQRGASKRATKQHPYARTHVARERWWAMRRRARRQAARVHYPHAPQALLAALTGIIIHAHTITLVELHAALRRARRWRAAVRATPPMPLGPPQPASAAPQPEPSVLKRVW